MPSTSCPCPPSSTSAERGLPRPPAAPPGAWIALVVALLLALTACGGTSITPPRPKPDVTDVRAAGASLVLARLRDALSHRDRAAVLRLAAPDTQSRRILAGVYANVARLRIDGISFRYLTEADGDTPGRLQRRYGDRAWSASVTLTYRIPGYDTGPTHMDVELAFVETPDGVRIAGPGGTAERIALWLTGRLAIVATPEALVLSAHPPGSQMGAQVFSGLATRAVRAVRKVLTGWRGKLVIELPASEAQLEQMLAVGAGQYRNIAAVTTTVDGTLVPGVPVHIFVNPQLFSTLQPRGRQVVISHETTHVATRAPFTPMPTWLLEGFADYVALAHFNIGVHTAASQIIAQVRRKGPPRHLPTAADLDPGAVDLGATYESAWTACNYLAQRYGERALLRFYDSVEHGGSINAAFRNIGVNQRAFVEGWRGYLRRLAGV